MKSRWAQIHVRMAQTAAPSTSLVGKPFEWTLYEVSLDLYGPPKILPWGGKISARFFIRMVHNLPRILEGIGTSTLRLHCNGHTGMQSPLQHVLFCIYAGWPSLSPLRRSWPLRGIREHGIASRDGCYVNKTPWSIVNAPLRDSNICLVLTISPPFMNMAPLMGKFENFGCALSNLLSVYILIEMVNPGSRALKYDCLGNNKAYWNELSCLLSCYTVLILDDADRFVEICDSQSSDECCVFQG